MSRRVKKPKKHPLVRKLLAFEEKLPYWIPRVRISWYGGTFSGMVVTCIAVVFAMTLFMTCM